MKWAVEMFLDHTCPHSYMAFTALRQVARARGLPVRWRTLPLVGLAGLSEPERAMHALRLEADWPRIQALAAGTFALELDCPRWSSDSRPAAAAAHWATRRAPEMADLVHLALFSAFFKSGLDVADVTVLSQVLAEIGLETGQLAEDLAGGQMDPALAADAAAAREHGVVAVPALVAGTYLLVGAQPVPVLERSLDLIAPSQHRAGGDHADNAPGADRGS